MMLNVGQPRNARGRFEPFGRAAIPHLVAQQRYLERRRQRRVDDAAWALAAYWRIWMMDRRARGLGRTA